MNDRIINKDDYFIEDRQGNKINLKDLHEKILVIMDEIDRICRKNNIPYALHAGSALGAINYKGFIPWDDDIDVLVAKKDYKRLINAFKKDMSKDFIFQCFETDKRYNVLLPNMKVRSKNTYIKEVNVLLPNRCKTGDGVYIDLSWYSEVSGNKIVDQIFRTIPKLLMPIMLILDNLHLDLLLLPFKYLVDWVSRFYTFICKNSKYVSQTIAIPWEKFLKEPIFLKSDIYPFKNCEFEGRTYMTYNNPENVVHKWYGPNCTKRWNGKEWEETYPVHKRQTKHVKDINLESNKRLEKIKDQ
ncbi:MAG: LicD family protein [Bacilli bacterium]|nr:LicD family protein [Bacilli bacterium]